jgi:hypothetical protein
MNCAQPTMMGMANEYRAADIRFLAGDAQSFKQEYVVQINVAGSPATNSRAQRFAPGGSSLLKQSSGYTVT